MSKNLFDYGEEDLSNANNKAENINYNNTNSVYQEDNNSNVNNSNTYNNINYQGNSNEVQEQAKNLYEKYKDYSQDNLIEEFLSTSKQKLKDGSLSQSQIDFTANALLPYLNDSQKQMMQRLLEQLK